MCTGEARRLLSHGDDSNDGNNGDKGDTGSSAAAAAAAAAGGAAASGAAAGGAAAAAAAAASGGSSAQLRFDLLTLVQHLTHFVLLLSSLLVHVGIATQYQMN